MRRRKPPTEDLDLPASRWSDPEIDAFVAATLHLPQGLFVEALKREVMDTWGFTQEEASAIVAEAHKGE